MALNLANYEKKAAQSVKTFWGNRAAAHQKQIDAGKPDAGSRGAVTAGKNMDGFVALMIDLVKANGLKNATIVREGRIPLTLPGYFRPTKQWDMLVLHDNRLVAALELKSQVGSSETISTTAPRKSSAPLMICGRLFAKARLATRLAPLSVG